MNLKPRTYLILAIDAKGGMGQKGKLPWNLPGDMKFFQKTTIATENIQYRNMVVMGRITWESIPEDKRPLKGRKNVIVTRNKEYKVGEGAIVAHSLDEAMKQADERVADIYVIGGAKIFDQVMKKHKVDGIYLTRIKKEFQCDVFFPRIPANFKPEKIGGGEDDGVEYDFLFYKKTNARPSSKPKSKRGRR